MEKNKHSKGGSSAFFWGLIVGALLATLLTTKKGRKVLRELIDVGLEMLEEFAQQKNVTNIPVVSKVKETVEEIKQEIKEQKEESCIERKYIQQQLQIQQELKSFLYS